MTTIKRRQFLKSAAAVAATLPLINSCHDPEIPGVRPKIVFFLIDDQRDDTLGCAGHSIIQTPSIDIPSSIVDIAEIQVPVSYQGRSLIPLIRRENKRGWRNDFFCEHLMDRGGIPKWEGVRGERYVYARYFEQRPAFEFLHDLQNDPDQLTNFAGDENYLKTLEKLRIRCDELKNEYSQVA